MERDRNRALDPHRRQARHAHNFPRIRDGSRDVGRRLRRESQRGDRGYHGHIRQGEGGRLQPALLSVGPWRRRAGAHGGRLVHCFERHLHAAVLRGRGCSRQRCSDCGVAGLGPRTERNRAFFRRCERARNRPLVVRLRDDPDRRSRQSAGHALGRTLGIMWMIASVVTIASLTAGITSQLAARRLEAAVRTSADLAVVRTGSVEATNAYDYLRAQHIDVRRYSSVAAGLEALKKGRLDAFVYDRPILEWNVRKGFLDDIKVLDKMYAKENYAIALPQSSPLRTRIDIAMIDELKGSWWRDILEQYLGAD